MKTVFRNGKEYKVINETETDVRVEVKTDYHAHPYNRTVKLWWSKELLDSKTPRKIGNVEKEAEKWYESSYKNQDPVQCFKEGVAHQAELTKGLVSAVEFYADTSIWDGCDIDPDAFALRYGFAPDDYGNTIDGYEVAKDALKAYLDGKTKKDE